MKRRNPSRIDEAETQAMHFKDPRSYYRKGKIFRFGLDMTDLRQAAFDRSKGFCEQPLRGVLSGRCNRNITFETGELHHDPSLHNGGDDTLDGVRFICRRCHVRVHGRTLRFGEGK